MFFTSLRKAIRYSVWYKWYKCSLCQSDKAHSLTFAPLKILRLCYIRCLSGHSSSVSVVCISPTSGDIVTVCHTGRFGNVDPACFITLIIIIIINMLSENVKPQPTMQQSFFCQNVSNTLVDELNYDRNCFINLILEYYHKSFINYWTRLSKIS